VAFAVLSDLITLVNVGNFVNCYVHIPVSILINTAWKSLHLW